MRQTRVSTSRKRATRDHPPCVLIVENSVDLRDVLEMLLTDEGFRTIACATTEAALALLDVEPVQLLITDLRLAGGSGLDLIRHLQTRSLTAPKVLVLTAAPPAQAAALAQFERVSVRIIAKPFDIDELLAVARELTGWRGPSPLQP